MAFQNKNMSVIAYANGFTMWHYSAKQEQLADVMKPGYFDPVYTLMDLGDLIIICAEDTTQTVYVKHLHPVTLVKQGE